MICRLPRLVLLVVALLAGIPFSSAAAQATWPVQLLIPELISIRAPTDAINFDLSGQGYPPLEFPVTYPGGTLPVQLHSSSQQIWTVSLEVSDIVSDNGMLLVPASQITYRVNGGGWLRANGFPQVIHSQNGPMMDWLEISIDFALELTGSERAGAYQVTATLTAQTEEF